MIRVGRWLADGLSLLAAVTLGLLAMQAPALTQEYATALLQVAQALDVEIAERQDGARQMYGLGTAPADQLMATLAAREPSNAETLQRTIARAAGLRASHARLEATPALLRPAVLLIDAASVQSMDRLRILWTSWDRFTPGLPFTTAAIVYGLAGLILGRVLSGGLLALPGLGRRRTA